MFALLCTKCFIVNHGPVGSEGSSVNMEYQWHCEQVAVGIKFSCTSLIKALQVHQVLTRQ